MKKLFYNYSIIYFGILKIMTHVGDGYTHICAYPSSSETTRMTEPIHPCIFFACDTLKHAEIKAIELGFTLEEFYSMNKNAGYDINWEESKVQYFKDLEAGKYQNDDEDEDILQDNCQDNCLVQDLDDTFIAGLWQ